MDDKTRKTIEKVLAEFDIQLANLAEIAMSIQAEKNRLEELVRDWTAPERLELEPTEHGNHIYKTTDGLLYWFDETGTNCFGPYTSPAEAIKELDEYAKSLENEDA